MPLFKVSYHGTTSTDIAKWHIFVNQTDIVGTTTQEFTMNILSTTENPRTAKDKFAPGSIGSFLIAIEPRDTQVSIRYDISIGSLPITNKTIKLSAVKNADTDTELTRTGENIYTGLILLGDRMDTSNVIDENYMANIEITYEWVNDETNNTVDTNMGLFTWLTVTAPISVTVSQYMTGETIDPYI